MQSVTDYAAFYVSIGLAPLAIHPRSKQPRFGNWQNPLPPATVISSLQAEASNIGVLFGVPSGNVVDIDFDCPEAVAAAHFFLPSTPFVFGRPGNPSSHRLYKTAEPATTAKFVDRTRAPDQKSMIVELRSTGTQSVLPPSIHESGEPITWNTTFSPAAPPEFPVLAPQALHRQLSKLAACVIAARHWPTGSRHQAALALSGLLYSHGFELEEAYNFMQAVCMLAHDDEAEDRVQAATDTFRKSKLSKKATGLPTLSSLIDPKAAEAISDLLFQDDYESVMKRMNEQYKFVLAGAKPCVAYFREKKGVNGARASRLAFLTQGDFIGYLRGEYVAIRSDDKVKHVALAKHWLDKPGKKKYQGVTFEPERTVDDDVLNMWRGWSYEPREGDCSLFLSHIRENVCQGDETYFRWLMSYLAHSVQRPWEKPGVAVVLRGGEGVGKSFMAHHIAKLCQEHAVTVTDPEHLVGKFNGQLNECLFLVANEAFFAGDRRIAAKLRSLVTDPTVTIELKGKDSFEVPNYMRIFMTSNEDWVVPAASDDRRYAVFDVGVARKNDRSYFASIAAQLENGGYSALFKYLKEYDYDKSFAINIPQTKARSAQQMMSSSPVQKWWMERLMDGDPFGIMSSEFKFPPKTLGWPEEVEKGTLYDDFADSRGDRRKNEWIDRVQFWVTLRNLMPETRDDAQHWVSYSVRTSTRGDVVEKKRKRFLVLPPLEDCRKHFAKVSKMAIDWPTVVDEAGPRLVVDNNSDKF